MKVLKRAEAMRMGYFADDRKRRRQHRKSAKQLRQICDVARVVSVGVLRWHLHQARYIGR